MIALATIVATIVSLAALAYLAATDPKRRRVFGVAPFEGRRLVGLALATALLPGVLLLGFGNGAGFVVWLGALSVAGWGVAAVSPSQATQLRDWTAALAAGGGRALALSTERLRAGVTSIGRWVDASSRMPHRIAALEDRVAALEAELAASREPHRRRGAVSGLSENDDAPVTGAMH